MEDLIMAALSNNAAGISQLLAAGANVNHADELRPREVEVDAIERRTAAETLAQAAQADSRLAHRPWSESDCGAAPSATRYTLPSVPGWKRSTSSRMRTFAR